MKLRILGTGAAYATKYNNTSFIIEKNDEYFLVDGTGGNDILKIFNEQDLDWNKLHNAYLSHKHTDHFLGMIWVIRYISGLILKGKYKNNFNLYLHYELKEKVLTVCKEILNPKETELIGKRIKLIVVNNRSTVNILNMKFTFFDINSTKAKQFGFRLDYSNKSLVFCGDEPLKKENNKYAVKADLLLLEAYCLDSQSNIYNPEKMNHNTVKKSAICANNLEVKKLLIYHTEDNTTYGKRQVLYYNEAKNYFSGEVLVPNDYDVLDI